MLPASFNSVMGLILPSICMFMRLISPSACETEGKRLPPPPSLLPTTWDPELHVDNVTGPPASYLQLPVFRHSVEPLLDKEQFFPARVTGTEPLPERVRRILLPTPEPESGPGFRVRKHGVRVACGRREMRVKVPRVFMGSVASRYQVKLGTCSSSRSSKHHRFFYADLHRCGTRRQIIHNRVVYSNTLHYIPLEELTEATPGSLRSLSGFSIPVQCHFNRFHYSYKIGFVPHVETQRLFKSMRMMGSAMLTPRDEQWNSLASSEGFTIGNPMYFQAEVPAVGEGERLFVHSCHVTTNDSHLSTPRLTVIDNYGGGLVVRTLSLASRKLSLKLGKRKSLWIMESAKCLIDSKNSRRSKFIKSSQRNIVRFSIDAFVFREKVTKHLYMHCEMSVRSTNTTATSKFCTYNQMKSRWEELYSSNKRCSCCNTTCISGAPAAMNRNITSAPWSMMEEEDGRREGHVIAPGKMADKWVEPHRTFEEVFGLD